MKSIRRFDLSLVALALVPALLVSVAERPEAHAEGRTDPKAADAKTKAAPHAKANKRHAGPASAHRKGHKHKGKAAPSRAKAGEQAAEEEELVFEPDPEPSASEEAGASPAAAENADEANESHALSFEQAASSKEIAPAPSTAPSLLDAPKRRRFYLRPGVLHMQPNVSSENVVLSNLSEFAELAISPGPIPNSGAGVAPVTVPVMNVGYVLPWLDGHLSVETVLGLPIELELQATGAMASESLAPFALGNVPTGVPAMGANLGTAKALPPIVTAVYRFMQTSIVHPYLGSGLSYMHVYDAHVTNPVLTDVAEPRLEVDDAFGVVAQAGVELRIYDRYYAMIDFKTIMGLRMDAKVRDIYIRTPELPVFEMAHAGDASVTIRMLPLIGTLALGADL